MTTQFIELPDGRIVNASHIRRVFQSDVYDGVTGVFTEISTGEHGGFGFVIADPDSVVYNWFKERAVPIAGEGDGEK